jgi:hypothetical protein
MLSFIDAAISPFHCHFRFSLADAFIHYCRRFAISMLAAMILPLFRFAYAAMMRFCATIAAADAMPCASTITLSTLLFCRYAGAISVIVYAPPLSIIIIADAFFFDAISPCCHIILRHYFIRHFRHCR